GDCRGHEAGGCGPVTADEVLGEIARRARLFGVSVILGPGVNVHCGDGTESGGYFCGDTRRLVVATGGSEAAWLGILLHEYCHLTQWVEDSAIWRSYR